MLPVAIVALLFAGFGCQKNETNNNTNASVQANANVAVNSSPANLNYAVVTNTAQPRQNIEESAIRRLVVAFTERYGSYSNQTNFGNLENLLPFMSDRFRRVTELFIESERKKERDTTIYYGITTRAVSSYVEQLDEDQGYGVFWAYTQRKESIGVSGNIQTFQENLRVVMRRQNGGWKVDDASWHDRR